MNFLVPLLFWALTISAISFSVAMFYYFLFSKNSSLKGRRIEKRVNQLIEQTDNFEFVKINDISFFFDKKNNKIIKI